MYSLMAIHTVPFFVSANRLKYKKYHLHEYNVFHVKSKKQLYS